RFPAGVVVYWTFSNGIRIFQQWAMYRYDPKVKDLVVADVKEVEARTREIDERDVKPTPTREQKPANSRPRLRDLLSGTSGGAGSKAASPETNKARGSGSQTGKPGAGGTQARRPAKATGGTAAKAGQKSSQGNGSSGGQAAKPAPRS